MPAAKPKKATKRTAKKAAADAPGARPPKPSQGRCNEVRVKAS